MCVWRPEANLGYMSFLKNHMTCLFVTGPLSMAWNSENIVRGFSVSPRDPPGSSLAALGLHADTTISDDFYVTSEAQTQFLLLAKQALY